ncbi:AraC family transcriptional regulator [Flavobacterium enshiense DK69]|uniref:AraC family transcriptional regulator n=1 Tax=Flavobacterium enshiense DK69 TaxID=1107311 RepID=V6SEL5_9FLAO|nr:AraC family transcriptional regulator [Flavobacterium enshiense]ESU22850.1 AraC family transcriptional regulator [Flavobacterium enshiense DK69]KGO93985.1 AraC family transcriptional regulator [Flavobacterium enshiense DK69]
MKVYVKNMVCHRCVLAVQTILDNLNLNYKSVTLGEIEFQDSLGSDNKEKLSQELQAIGFELIDDKKNQLIERIKSAIITHIHHDKELIKINLSDFLASELGYEYNYLSNLFSEVEGTTIEKYVILQKIEKVKELIVYDELSLKEIASLLGYSSVAYLSNQFKKVTGLTPSHFKIIGQQKRVPLDHL